MSALIATLVLLASGAQPAGERAPLVELIQPENAGEVMPGVVADPTTQPSGAIWDMSRPFEVAQINRLAITPTLDGLLEPEEWDPLSEGLGQRSYFQWQPSALFLGVETPIGQDAVISLDLNGDGWLVGADNVELRARWGDGAPVVETRLLDATARQGPEWTRVPVTDGMLFYAGVQNGGTWTLECKLLAIGLVPIEANRKIGIRIDPVSSTAERPLAYLPRPTALTYLAMDRSAGLPSGLEWKPEYRLREVAPGEDLRLKLNFTNTGDAQLFRAAMRSLGLARAYTTVTEMPVPAFDRRGRSTVEYASLIQRGAPVGYRVFEARVSAADGTEFVIESSYKVADLVMYEVGLPRDLKSTEELQVIRLSVGVRSLTRDRLDGVFRVSVPQDWTIKAGTDRAFTIYQPRGLTRVGVELIAPAGAKGLIPVTFTSEIGERKVEQTIYLPLS